jgi:TPR repeat protein
MRRRVILAATLAVAVVLAPGGAIGVVAAAEDAIADCPEGDGWLECRAQAGDPLAIYRLGRTAYEEARESGDFSEALRLSRQLAATGDKNGERLLKMVHMQLGWGAHKDYVQAYQWLNEDNKAGSDYLDKWIKTLAAKMTPEQLEQAGEPVAN